jgi:hypothetical protein
MLKFIAKQWQRMRDIGAVLRPCRFSILVVVAGFALLFTPQGTELTVGLSSARWWPVVAFHLSVFLWAFQSWYWARVTLDFAFGADRGAKLDHPRSAKIQVYINRAPRWIAIATYAIAIIACWGYWKSVLVLAVVAVAFYFMLVKRLDWTNKWLGENHFLLQHKGPLPVLSWVVIGLTLIANVGLFFWIAINPVGFGWTFGAAAVAFIGFSMIAAIGSMLVLLTREGGTKRLQKASGEETAAAADKTPLGIFPGYPVVRTLIVIAVLWSLIPALDNHEVRTVADAPRPGKTLKAALDEWYAQAPDGPGGRKNFVVVSAAGGGLRAGYWAATVLGATQDRVPDFRKQLVAVSGVSGGSLGALVFVTLLAQDSPPQVKCIGGPDPRGPYECAGQTVLSQDFLAPTVAALLFPDLMQRFVPLGFPDRAQALEQSWERSWAVAGFEDDPWGARGFRSLWEGKHLPALLLNGTHVQTGKRVLTSNLDIAAQHDAFLNVYDFYKLSPAKDIRPSTAAHNSARFTYVSPASTLPDGTHLVDGGYFENFGAVTARELIDAALYHFGQKKIQIRPVAIVISNDPELRPEDFPANPAQETPAPVRKFPWASEVMSPLRAMLHTRDARGLLAAADLRATVEYYYGGNYFQFRLCKDIRTPKRADPALGWVLSDESEEYMRWQLARGCDNKQQLDDLTALLGAKPTAASK